MSSDDDQLDRSTWGGYFESLTKVGAGDPITIEVLHSGYGDELQAAKLPLSYIEYDPHRDTFAVAVGGCDGRYPVVLSHFIEHPTSISIRPTPTEPDVIEVEAVDGSRTRIIHYRGTTDRRQSCD